MDSIPEIVIQHMNRFKEVRKRLPILLLFFTTLSAFAQSEQDIELWQGISLESEVLKDLTLRLDDQLRLDNNIFNFKLNLINLEATYKVNKFFRGFGGYRYTLLPVVNRHRLYAGGLLRKEVDILQTEFQFRTTFQYELDKKQNTSSHLRPMFYAQYEPKGVKFEPYFGAELFYRLDGEDTGGAEQYRFYLGVDYELTSKNILRAGYVYEQDIKGASPIQSHAFMLGFKMDIETKKKKKKGKKKKS